MDNHTSHRGFSFASELRRTSGRLHSSPAEVLARLPDSILVDLGAGEIRAKVPWGPRSRSAPNESHEVVGLCRIASIEELAGEFPGAPFLDLLPPCPFREEHLAWLLWDIPGLCDESAHVGLSVAELSLGRSVDLRDGRFFDAMVERQFLLSEVAEKTGFGDGSLVQGSRAHEEHVYLRLADALRKAGVREHLTHPDTFTTLHNPFRLLGVDAAMKTRLAAHTVQLWVRHPVLLRPGEFFC